MGCGTGIQSLSVNAEEIVCADINEKALEYAKEKLKGLRAEFVKSDLFEKVKGKFDLIAFNTPYLDEEEPKDYAWTYKQRGRDVIEEFIRKVAEYLEEGGSVLMVISDRGFERYREIAEEKGFRWRVLKEKPLFFERLYLVELVR